MKEDRKRFLGNVLIVLLSNVFSVVSGVLIGFIVPKMMGVTEYGYYKTFTLYSSYVCVLHFGFIDGIYLKFAGKKFEELDKERFRTYTRFLFLIESIITLLVAFSSLFFIGTNLFLIILFVSLNILATNIVTYYEFITQITMRFKRTTIRNVIRCSFNILSVAVMFLLYRYCNVVIYNYTYAIITLSINYILAIWYIITYWTITFGKSTKMLDEKGEIISFFKIGIPLLLSNLVAQLVFIVDQQFVNIAFDVDTYSVYAFAYSMIGLITIATNAVSVVLYPTLKTISEDSITRNYSRINAWLLMFVALCLISYYPLVIIVTNYLQKYIGSLPTFLIILPGVMISSSISVIKYNCYKTFGKINNYFIKSVTILIIAIIADLIVFFIFKDTKSISIVSIFVLLAWYIIIELYFIRAYKVKWIKNLLYLVLIIIGFYGISFVPNIFLAMSIYFVFYLMVTFTLYFEEIKLLLTNIKERKNAKQ